MKQKELMRIPHIQDHVQGGGEIHGDQAELLTMIKTYFTNKKVPLVVEDAVLGKAVYSRWTNGHLYPGTIVSIDETSVTPYHVKYSMDADEIDVALDGLFCFENPEENPVVEQQFKDYVAKFRQDIRDAIEKERVAAEEEGRDPNFSGNCMLFPVCDVSASMNGDPMLAAIGIGILTSLLTHEKLSGRVMSFSKECELTCLDGLESLRDMVQTISNIQWGQNTDMLNMAHTVASFCQEYKIPAEELPEAILILSDMQFDHAHDHTWADAHERIEQIWRDHGYYKCPQIIFWNLRASNTQVVPSDRKGVSMLSGFSPMMLKSVFSGEMFQQVVEEDEDDPVELTPYETVVRLLENDAYDPVRAELDGGCDERLDMDADAYCVHAALVKSIQDKCKEYKDRLVGVRVRQEGGRHQPPPPPPVTFRDAQDVGFAHEAQAASGAAAGY